MLFIEIVLPPGDTRHPGKIPDIVMLLLPGWSTACCGTAGFRTARVVPTESAVSVVEPFPA